MVKIYGYSDDIVCIENSRYFEDEIGCFDVAGVRLYLDDGTVLLSASPLASGVFSSSRKVPRRTGTRSVRRRMRTTTAMSFTPKLMLFGMKLHRRETEGR